MIANSDTLKGTVPLTAPFVIIINQCKREKNMSDKNVLVATYGSLRRGMGNFGVNAAAGGEYCCSGKTKDNIDLFEYCKGFPSVSLKHSEAGKPVVVDIFKTTAEGLRGAYDALEGHHGNDSPHTFYKRTEVPVILDSGEEVTCWIYHIDEQTGPLVEHGDWCLHKDPGYYGE